MDLADLLRGRILRGLHGAALRRGDRLPSAREVGVEFALDHRLVLDAYRLLAQEGLVELRPRGGIYVAGSGGPGQAELPSDVWLSEIFAQGLAREIPLTELHEWLHRAVSTRRLRAVAVQGSRDQVDAMRRELADEYGFEAKGVEVDALVEAGASHPDLRYADVLVTTEGMAARVRPVAESIDTPLIVVDLRPDLIPGEWRLLLFRPLYVLVGDERFIGVLMDFFANTPGIENLRPLVVGRDDLSVIPDDATVYVTANARQHLKDVQIRGRVLPTVRLFSRDSSLTLIQFIVAANLAALGNRWPAD
jgi:DNA-binding transcriptional regulator YhcF (GntR family)